MNPDSNPNPDPRADPDPTPSSNPNPSQVPAETFGYPLRLMMDASLICFMLVTSFVVCNAALIARPRSRET